MSSTQQETCGCNPTHCASVHWPFPHQCPALHTAPAPPAPVHVAASPCMCINGLCEAAGVHRTHQCQGNMLYDIQNIMPEAYLLYCVGPKRDMPKPDWMMSNVPESQKNSRWRTTRQNGWNWLGKEVTMERGPRQGCHE